MSDTAAHTDHDLARVTAHLLRTTRYGWHFNWLLFMSNAWWGLGHAQSLTFILLSLLLLLIILYYLLRIQLDADILNDVGSEKISLLGLDKALAQLNLRKQPSMTRTLLQRCQACMDLLKIFWLLTLLHVCITLSHIFIMFLF